MTDFYDIIDQWDPRGHVPLRDVLARIPDPTPEQLAEIDDEIDACADELELILSANGLTSTPECIADALDASMHGEVVA